MRLALFTACLLACASACNRTAKGPQPSASAPESTTPEGTPSPGTVPAEPAQPVPAVPQTVGAGSLAQPAQGPAPTDAKRVTGAPFVLVKNWDFGATGTVRNTAELIGEFDFHDHWGTIANGTHYGAVIVAPTEETAISVPEELGLPGNRQPVEDPTRPNREFTQDSLKAHVRPLSAAQKTVSTKAHNAGCGSFVAKWRLPTGGKHLERDILWETRARMPVPKPGYWFAIWTAGTKWEAFGAPHLMEAKVFHVNSVGGRDHIDYDNWFSGLEHAGVPSAKWDLKRFHIWTWIYKRDDSYEVFYDGHLAQRGTLHWTQGAVEGGPSTDMAFLFDFTWGHTDVPGVDVTLPATSLPVTYEIDYSRVYMR